MLSLTNGRGLVTGWLYPYLKDNDTDNLHSAWIEQDSSNSAQRTVKTRLNVKLNASTLVFNWFICGELLLPSRQKRHQGSFKPRASMENNYVQKYLQIRLYSLVFTIEYGILPRCQSSEQLQPIRTSQMILCVKRSKSTGHAYSTSSSLQSKVTGHVQWWLELPAAIQRGKLDSFERWSQTQITVHSTSQ